MKRWPQVPFGQLVRQRRETVKPLNQDQGLPYLGLEHFNQGGGLANRGLVSDATGAKFRFIPGDTLYGRLRPYFRKTIYTTFEGYCSTEIWVLEPQDPNILLPEYLSYIVLDQAFTDFAMQGAQGTKMPRASWEHVSRYLVSLPTLAEQKEIVGVLSKFDAIAENNESLIADLRNVAVAAYVQAVSAKSEVQRLCDVVSINPKQTRKQSTGQLTYLDITSVGDDRISWPSKIEWSDAPSRARRLASKGSTIWSTVRPNRRAHALLTYVPDDLVVSTGFAVLEPKNIGPAELFCATHGASFVDFLMSRADGSAYPAVRPEAIADAPIAMLSEAESRDFEAKVWPLLNAAGELYLECQEMVGVRNALLPQLISGSVEPRGV